MAKPKVGVVIGSGGLKPLGVTCFFDLLEKNNLKPDVLIGCSGGTIFSSYWGSGKNVEELYEGIECFKQHVKEYNALGDINIRTLLNIGHYPGGRFTKSSGIIGYSFALDFFLKMMGKDHRLEDNLIKTVVMSTDLDTGKSVPLEKGPLARSVYASCAMYPVMPAIEIDGKWLVDGAYYSALPVMEAIRQGCDKIIVLSYEENVPECSRSFFENYLNFISLVLIQNAKKQNAMAINLHHDEILFVNFYFDKPVKFWDIDCFPYIKELSESVVKKHEQDILRMFI